MKTIFVVNCYRVRYNLINNRNKPTISIHQDGKTLGHCQKVIIHGPSVIVNDPANPMWFGSATWMETEANFDTIGFEPCPVQ